SMPARRRWAAMAFAITVSSSTISTRGICTPQVPCRSRDSPPRRAFRPPAERTFESPLAFLRLVSTYSAALSGAEGKLEQRDPAGNRHSCKQRTFSSSPSRQHVAVTVVGEQSGSLLAAGPAQV